MDSDIKRSFLESYPLLSSYISELKEIPNLETISNDFDISVPVIKRFKRVKLEALGFLSIEYVFRLIAAMNIHSVPFFDKDKDEFIALIQVIQIINIFEGVSDIDDRDRAARVADLLDRKSKEKPWSSLRDHLLDMFITLDFTKLSNYQKNVTPLTQPWFKDLCRYLFILIVKIKVAEGDAEYDQINLMDLFNKNYSNIYESIYKESKPEDIFKLGFRWYNFMSEFVDDVYKDQFYSQLNWSLKGFSVSNNDFNVEEITEGKRLSEEGIEMKNCVYLYHFKLIDGNYAVLHFKGRDLRDVTIEVDLHSGTPQITQAKLKDNIDLEVDSHEYKHIQKYLEDTEIRRNADKSVLMVDQLHDFLILKEDDLSLEDSVNSIMQSLKLNWDIDYLRNFKLIN